MSVPATPSYFISSETLLGSNIYDGAGRKLGAIKEIFLDPVSGRVAYVIGGSGGLLGVGAKFHPLPWDRLHERAPGRRRLPRRLHQGGLGARPRL